MEPGASWQRPLLRFSRSWVGVLGRDGSPSCVSPEFGPQSLGSFKGSAFWSPWKYWLVAPSRR